ncbi:DUF3455 domain-containing protein [Rivibacter subsaxonicus]|uniref:DUF3455 domain-containing protein n=1 Tax=Rivibacter subsaxonicus TaxID=457575 RepID=UPI003BF8F96A
MATDGSRIVGRALARADAPQDDAIPWLLLSARSAGGAGRYAAVTRVQRVNTSGGVAPSGGCDGGSLGVTARVPYEAEYLMFGA